MSEDHSVEKIVKEGGVLLRFSSGSVGRYPGCSGGELFVYDDEKLLPVPTELREDGWEVYKVDLNDGRKVAYARQVRPLGSDDEEDYYEGPFSVEGLD